MLIGLLFVQSFLWAQIEDKIYISEKQRFNVQKVLQRNDVLWGFDFLKDGRLVVTERAGVLLVYDPKSKQVKTIQGVPRVFAKGQGGLLDVRVHPQDERLFFTYAESLGDRNATTALAVARLEGERLVEFKKLFSAQEPNANTIHFGSRVEFDRDGHVFFTVGDRDQRPHAQDLRCHTGKVIRLKLDGSVPKDNPFYSRGLARPEIWSIGHRSPQGLARDPVTGHMWQAEMGPRGGDEVNLLIKGGNYGWPSVTFGREYWGPRIGVTHKSGVIGPVAHWVPSISPSGLMIYRGDRFPEWNGDIFLACLSGMQIRRLAMHEGQVIKQEELLKDLNTRFRAIRQGPDGLIYVSTDAGALLRLQPIAAK